MKKKFALILVILIIFSFVASTPLPVEAIGGYCTMRSEVIIAAADAPRFGLGTADVTIEVDHTVGHGVTPAAGGALNHTTPMWGLICMIGTVGYITRIIFWVLVPVFLILGILGGFAIMTAAGDDKKVTAGKNRILYAVIGFVLLFLIRGLPAMIRFMIGM